MTLEASDTALQWNNFYRYINIIHYDGKREHVFEEEMTANKMYISSGLMASVPEALYNLICYLIKS